MGEKEPSILISTHGGVAIEFFAFFVKELHCPPPEGTTAAKMIAIPGNTALSVFRLTLDEKLAQKRLEEVIARPGELMTDCVCLKIHDRSHCVGTESAAAPAAPKT